MKPVFRSTLTLLLLGLTRVMAPAQGAESYFHPAANAFINGQNAEARQTLQAGLQRYPADPKMRSLLKEIKESEQKKQQEKNKEQSQREQRQKEQQQEQRQKEQQQKEQQQKEQQAQNQVKKEPPPETRAEGKEKPGEKPEERQVTREKLREMNLTEEKARMILDAMKTNEIQYLQQRRREKTQRTDKNKADW